MTFVRTAPIASVHLNCKVVTAYPPPKQPRSSDETITDDHCIISNWGTEDLSLVDYALAYVYDIFILWKNMKVRDNWECNVQIGGSIWCLTCTKHHCVLRWVGVVDVGKLKRHFEASPHLLFFAILHHLGWGHHARSTVPSCKYIHLKCWGGR